MLKLIQSITGIYELTWGEILLGISLAVVVYFALVIILSF
jgi:uncharacterized membrane protein